MAASILKLVALDEELSSPAEIVAAFTGPELLAASRETSPVYDGLVLGMALQIVQQRTKLSTHQIAKRIGYARNTIYSRWLRGLPIRHHSTFERAMRDLAMLLVEISTGASAAK